MARFDLIARVYDLLPIPTHVEAVAQRTHGLPTPRLDIGGGTARFSQALHPDVERPVVLDPSPGMLARARRAGRRIDPVQGLGQEAPFPDDTFGAVTITEAFHHTAPHQAELLDEIARILHPDGRLVIEEIDPHRFLGRAVELGENLILRFGSVFLTPGELGDLLRDRFDQVSVERTGSFTYIAQAQDPRT